MTVRERPDELARLQAAAEAAEARYDHETAVASYTAALQLPDLTLPEKIELLQGRLTAYQHWGHQNQVAQDVAELIALARQMGDKRLLAATMAVYGYFLAYDGPQEPPEAFAREALKLAEDLQDNSLICYAYLTLVQVHYEQGEVDTAWKLAHESEHLARRSQNQDTLFTTVEFLAGAYAVFNQPEEAQRYAAEARALAEASGNLYKMGQAAKRSGLAATDLAVSRMYYEEALANARSVNDQLAISAVANLMGMLTWMLGLYDSALAYTAEAVEGARRLELTEHVGNNLDTAGRAYLAKGMLDEARRVFNEGFSLEQKSWTTEVFYFLGQGLVALAEGANEEAIGCFQQIQESFDPLKPFVHAVLGSAYLAINESEKALVTTSRAVSLLDAGQHSMEFPLQEVWWRHYQVLRATDQQASFAVLERAKQVMLSAIETLSDEGLRRNYLNKVAVNRAITLAWTAEAALRDIPLDLFTAHKPIAGNLREQFRRVVEIGARLAAEHDPAELADFIVQEFVEMSGAERVLLLRSDNDRTYVAAAYNPAGAEELAQTALETSRQSRRPHLRQNAGQAADGVVPELYQRSLIALPLIAQGRLLGLLYGDMRQIFGRFDENDLQLLSMLANQAAAALDNAGLVTTLEERVAERTADLAQRNNELAIINSVQEGLVAELDLQAIFDLVGDQIYEISQAQAAAICTFDYEMETVQTRYDIEDGRRIENTVRAIDPGLWEYINNPRTLYLPTLEEIKGYFGTGIVDKVVAGTVVTSSILYIPMIVGDTVVGYLDLQDEQPHAFSESNIRLLTTLARSTSMALENARLFRAAEDAREEAEQANESKSRFLASMSHELRTPLNAIIGFTRIVQRKTQGTIPQKQSDNLAKVRASAEHLLGLINTVLDIAKVEAGRMDVINEPFEIAELVKLCTAVTKPMFKPGVQLKLEIDPHLPVVTSDQDKVKQILLNLLSNAAKFTHEGEIVASCRLQVAGGGQTAVEMLVLEVRDTGIGMNEEQLGRVFEEFQQAEKTTNREYGGTGLGLPISKKLAQLLGGDLTAESWPGLGSTFTLVVPVVAIS